MSEKGGSPELAVQLVQLNLRAKFTDTAAPPRRYGRAGESKAMENQARVDRGLSSAAAGVVGAGY